jgi:uncharacterized membrane protein YgcG
MSRTHVIVDGSNIATEGRAAPSLKQLDEAVRALIDEFKFENVTVVVDATFGHRIDAKERAAYEEAVLNGELITPPAGAIGRGDAFVLQIADRAHADVLSNDSFQEFHGKYTWLFDEGRLIGGKPVPHVGWVFVLRAPVRGPASRRSVRDAKKAPARKLPSLEPLPSVPAVPPPRKSRARSAAMTASEPAKAPERSQPAAKRAAGAEPAAGEGRSSRRRRGGSGSGSGARASAGNGGGSGANGGGGATTVANPLNDQLTYLSFVVDHPVGSTVDAIVDRFSSHGAYVRVGAAQCYVPLRSLGDPPPRSAREVLDLGETRPFTVTRFDPARRGIDVVPATAITKTERGSDAAKAVASAAGTTNQQEDAEEALVSPAAKKASARKAPAKKRAAAKKAVKRKATAKRAPARKTAAKKTTARKAPARKKAAAKKTTARKKATAKRAPARKTAAKRTTARKATKKKATARKAPARKTAARKTTARKTTARKATKRTTKKR